MKLSEKAWDWFIKKTGLINNTLWNRYHWKSYLQEEQKKFSGMIGYEWGNPEDSHDYYGNYKQVLDWLRGDIRSDSHVLEIGSLGGKWTQYMSQARLVTCVDLFVESFQFLQARLGTKANLQFYQSRGNELKGIPDRSVDLIFSMDAFPRIPKASIQSYFIEMFRVLKEGGKILVHLPCRDIPFCRRKAFTPISSQWIRSITQTVGFKKFKLHFDLIKHGVMVQAVK